MIDIGIFNPDDIPRDPRKPITTEEALSRLPDRERILVMVPFTHGYLGRQATREEVEAKIRSRPAYHPCGPARFMLADAVVEFMDDDAVPVWICTREPGARLSRAWSTEPQDGEMLERVN